MVTDRSDTAVDSGEAVETNWAKCKAEGKRDISG